MGKTVIAAALLASRREGDNVLITGESNSSRFARSLVEAGIQVGMPAYPGCVVLESPDCGSTFYMWMNARDIETMAAVWGEELVEKLMDAYLNTEVPELEERSPYDEITIIVGDGTGD